MSTALLPCLSTVGNTLNMEEVAHTTTHTHTELVKAGFSDGTDLDKNVTAPLTVTYYTNTHTCTASCDTVTVNRVGEKLQWNIQEKQVRRKWATFHLFCLV